MKRTYIPQLVRLTKHHLQFIVKHQSTINKFLDAAGQSDLQDCINCAVALLGKLESLQPGSTSTEQA